MSTSAASAPESAARPALGGLRAWLAWAAAVAFVVYYFSFQTGYAIVNASVQRELSLSLAQVGMIAATYTWVFAVCQLLSGPTLDRLGARRVLLPAIVMVTVGIVLFASARRFEMLLLSQALVAIGASTGFVGAGYVGGQWFGMAKFSFMFGLVQFSASIFSVINQNVLDWALSTATWRGVFWTAGAIGVALLCVAFVFLRDPVQPSTQDAPPFFADVGRSLAHVARVPHVWVAAIFGALVFGPMLALGVVWGPKLLATHGVDARAAIIGTSMLWLGLAAGCFVAPWVSDRLQNRKRPILVGVVLQIAALATLLYVAGLSPMALIVCCFLFGFGNAAHMLAFSSAADVVEPRFIGTSAAIVNGLMFVVGGILMSRPGLRMGLGIEEGVAPGTLAMAQYAGRPLLISVIIALVVAVAMRETYPRR
jgi:MFS family permease